MFIGFNVLDNKLNMMTYNDLEVFKIDDIGFKLMTCIIEDSGGHLREISTTRYYHRRTHQDSLHHLIYLLFMDQATQQTDV
jgi:hypothetical protein